MMPARGPAGSGFRGSELGDTDQNVVSSSDTSTKVRSNFPETWIWTEAVTGCVIAVTVVYCCCNRLSRMTLTRKSCSRQYSWWNTESICLKFEKLRCYNNYCKCRLWLLYKQNIKKCSRTTQWVIKNQRYYSFTTSANVGRFSKFFNLWIQKEIYNKTHVSHHTLTICNYTTLQNLKCHFYHFITAAVTKTYIKIH